jgi:hypothetical protein
MTVQSKHFAGGGAIHSAATPRITICLEALMAISGLGGGVFMTTHAATMMPLWMLSRTPFADWTWPGIFLTLFVGLGPLLAIAAQFMHWTVARAGHFMVGFGMIAWIVLEIAWITWYPLLQLPYLLVGIAIVTAAWREGRPVA